MDSDPAKIRRATADDYGGYGTRDLRCALSERRGKGEGYAPYLEIMFGPDYEVIPVLVLTAARELFRFEPIGKNDMVLPVWSGDMLFNAFDEYLGFLCE